MSKHRRARRVISIVVAAAMMTPAVASAVAAATGTWLSPQPGRKITSRNVEVSVGYNTQSDLKVTRLELWVDGRRVAARTLARPESRGVCSFWWDTAKFSRGAHKVSVKIFAGDNLLSTVSNTLVIGEAAYDLRAPNVVFSDIKSGDVLKGTAAIRMAVADDGGEPPIVTLLVDNALRFLSNRKPYVYALDTTKYADGVHELQTFAYDSAGNKSEPVVVRVSFKNGIQKPMAASIETEAVPRTTAPSEDDGVGKLLPPVLESKAGAEGLARASEPDLRATTPAAARPVPRGAVEPAKAVPPPRTQSAASPRPAPTASKLSAAGGGAVPQQKPRLVENEPLLSAMAVEPVLPGPPRNLPVIEPADESVPQASPAPAQPTLKGSAALSEVHEKLEAHAPAVVAPKARLAPPTSGEPSAAAVETVPTPRPIGAGLAAAAHAQAVEPAGLEKPTASRPNAAAVRKPTPELREVRAALNPMGREPEAPQAPVGEPAAAPPKPIQAAMLPSVRNEDGSPTTHVGIICPPPIREDGKAVLDKRLLLAKGKIKLRDLVNELGGVVFWDGETHTATAYVNNLKIEVQVGSPTVKVNGRKMRTGLIPRIANGRTIIEAALYAQACEFAARISGSASARAH